MAGWWSSGSRTRCTLLERDAALLNADIGTSPWRALRTQADATSWTGFERVRQDEIDLFADEADAAAIQTSIEALVADAAGIVAGLLNPTLDGLRDDITVAGTASSAVAVRARGERRPPAPVVDLVLNGDHHEELIFSTGADLDELDALPASTSKVARTSGCGSRGPATSDLGQHGHGVPDRRRWQSCRTRNRAGRGSVPCDDTAALARNSLARTARP